MRLSVAKFIRDESGAITVDWVVLTAAIVAFNVALLFGIIRDGIFINMQYVYNQLITAIDQ